VIGAAQWAPVAAHLFASLRGHACGVIISALRFFRVKMSAMLATWVGRRSARWVGSISGYQPQEIFGRHGLDGRLPEIGKVTGDDVGGPGALGEGTDHRVFKSRERQLDGAQQFPVGAAGDIEAGHEFADEGAHALSSGLLR
jgi:hypothetical protein